MLNNLVIFDYYSTVNKNISVGKVKIDYIDGASTEYSDGDTEDRLLNLFKSDNAEAEVKKILTESSVWPLIYHLSPQRGNIVSWYDFTPGSRVLELGSGPGAITSALLEKYLKVTGIDISERRSLINAHRHSDNENLQLVVGNFDRYSPKEKFDYVVCIGVLEYAESFVKSNAPYEYFLQQIKKCIKPGGKILLAIENKLGLKYWAGTSEDHTGVPMDSINDYATTKKGVRTFSRHELTQILKGAGFKNLDFYFPHPDYKLPSIIFSESVYPGHGTDFPLAALPSNDYSGTYHNPAFYEQLAMLSLEKSNLYPEFANSFLVVCNV